MPATERHGGPQTIGQALAGAFGGRGDPDGPLELNRMESAVCHRCGLEPRLYHHLSPKGRDVTIWIPQDHTCRPGRHQNAHQHVEMLN